MSALTRRRLLVGGCVLGLGLLGTRLALPRLLRTGPVRPLDPDTAAFVARCFAGLEPTRLVDTHVHLLGTETARTGAWVHPAYRSHLHPFRRLEFELFRAAAGVSGGARPDDEYVERLLERARAALPGGRLLLLAFDCRVGEDGREDRERSLLHVPDAWVAALAAAHPEFLAAASIHPYRRDALARLEAAAAAGARAIKWLPAAMAIDPASPLCDAFYRRAAELRLPLVTHAGRESALSEGALQALGHPLRLRRPLDAGVRVVVAHCGSGGRGEDLDLPAEQRGELDLFDAFLRLFDEKQYEKNLFADVAGLPFVDRQGRPLRTMLLESRWHHRLVNGSDYPVCALDPALSTRALAAAGYLTAEERVHCERVFDSNPLLFDFVVKRSVAVREGGRVYRFAPTVFETDWLFA